jgi:23S rRNA (uracil1939-C5)-methyltransferase
LNIPNVIGADRQYFYRNKLEFSFSSNRWLTEEDSSKETGDKTFALGFHKPGFIDKVIDINKCYLQSDFSNKILTLTREFFKSRNTSIYSAKTHEGFLRYLVIRQSLNTNDSLLNLISSGKNDELIREYSDFIIQNIKGDSKNKDIIESLSIAHSISYSKANVAQADEYFVLRGNGFIREKIKDLNFKISPFSFFQTNTGQCEKLFDTLVESAEFTDKDNVLDLYCGCGAISLFISTKVNSVTGVELYDESILSARENATINDITNCEFITYDVKDFLKSQIAISSFSKKYNIIVLDPPRSGIHPKAAEYLRNLEPDKIIYVSCNPTTQARDVKLLSDKYTITFMQPVDMFPHTFHIENIVRLDKK